MNQEQQRRYLITYLLHEKKQYQDMAIPESDREQKALLRALMNVRRPGAVDAAFLKVQDAYLAERAKEKGIVTLDRLEALPGGIYLWQRAAKHKHAVWIRLLDLW